MPRHTVDILFSMLNIFAASPRRSYAIDVAGIHVNLIFLFVEDRCAVYNLTPTAQGYKDQDFKPCRPHVCLRVYMILLVQAYLMYLYVLKASNDMCSGKN